MHHRDDESSSRAHVKEDEWHYKLREEFINYYTQYLQSQGFALVQSAAAEPSRTAKGYVTDLICISG